MKRTCKQRWGRKVLSKAFGLKDKESWRLFFPEALRANVKIRELEALAMSNEKEFDEVIKRIKHRQADDKRFMKKLKKAARG